MKCAHEYRLAEFYKDDDDEEYHYFVFFCIHCLELISKSYSNILKGD